MTATEPPAFGSAKEYRSRIADVGFWRPYISRILKRHDLSGMERGVMAGHNATYPTFLCGDVVVKLFGHFPPWRKSHAAECSALHLVANDPKIAAPRLLASGSIFRDSDMPWPYLVTGRIPGVQCWRAELSAAQLTALAVDLGRQIRRVHALQPIRVMPQVGIAGRRHCCGSLPEFVSASPDTQDPQISRPSSPFRPCLRSQRPRGQPHICRGWLPFRDH